MSTNEQKRPPRIVFSFAALVLALVFVAASYFFLPHENPAAYLQGTQTLLVTGAMMPQQDATERMRDAAELPLRAAAGMASEQAQKEASRRATPTEAPVAVRATRHKIEGDAATSVAATNANGILTQAIGTIEDKGYTVAFVVHDVQTGREITYNSNQELYPASSIKGPFVASVYQQLVEKGEVKLKAVEPTAKITILESSDEGYRTLIKDFGVKHFIQWLKDAGVEPGSYKTYESMTSWNYPHISARQLELMWAHLYDYLTKTDSDAAKQLADFFDKREESSLRKALDPSVRSWSKMGWFDRESEYHSAPATVEAGVVFADNGPYVVSVMTTMPALLDELVPLHRALYRAHMDMVPAQTT